LIIFAILILGASMVEKIIKTILYTMFNIPDDSLFGEALLFFVYNNVKIFFLITIVIFIVAVIRSYFAPEKTRDYLAKKGEFTGNVLAALLGVVTPFCSCSAVPLFLGFIGAGVPLGVTFSFLVASPLINEVSIILLWTMFGWKIGLLYISTGLAISVLSGLLIGKLKLEHLLMDTARTGGVIQFSPVSETEKVKFSQRLSYARDYTVDVIKRIWIFVIAAVALAAVIHEYIPARIISQIAGRENPFAVLIAVLIGIPLYASCGGCSIPLVQALTEKGVQIGTALAFMMAVTGLSLPEFIILGKVMKVKLILIFAGIVGVGIVLTGYLFNFVLG
jgi:uncharacterized protein